MQQSIQITMDFLCVKGAGNNQMIPSTKPSTKLFKDQVLCLKINVLQNNYLYAPYDNLSFSSLQLFDKNKTVTYGRPRLDILQQLIDRLGLLQVAVQSWNP